MYSMIGSAEIGGTLIGGFNPVGIYPIMSINLTFSTRNITFNTLTRNIGINYIGGGI